MTTNQRTVNLSRFKGLNKKQDPAELDAGELVSAVNVDLTDNEKLRLRKGQTRIDANATRKLWADGRGRIMLAVQGTNLVLYDKNLTATVLRSDMSASMVADFDICGDQVFYADGKVNGRVSFAGTASDWVVEEPPGQPALSSAGGSLYEGLYHVNVTYIHQDGRESGTGESAEINISGGGILLTGISVPVSANIQFKNIYCSDANGLVPRFIAQIPAAQTTYTITSRRTGYTLDKQFMCPPPLATQVAFTQSRIWVASGSYVYGSLPYTYHLYDQRYEYMAFPETVDLLARTESGLYVSADQMYFIDLEGEDPTPRVLSTSKAIVGSKTYMPAEDVGEGDPGEMLPVFTMENGIVYGTRGGTLVNMTKSKLDIGKVSSAATMYRKEGGITQVITSVKGEGANLGANLYEDPTNITVIRKGTVLESFNLIDHDGLPVIDKEGKPVVYQE